MLTHSESTDKTINHCLLERFRKGEITLRNTKRDDTVFIFKLVEKDCIFKGDSIAYFVIDGHINVGCGINKPIYKTEDFFILKRNKMKEKFPIEISSANASKLVLAACQEWQKELLAFWGIHIIKNEPVSVNKILYHRMRNAATLPQHVLLDEVFGPEEEHPKDGTPCLVRAIGDTGWALRYADGKGGFYLNGRKQGPSCMWGKWMILDMNNLPVTE